MKATRYTKISTLVTLIVVGLCAVPRAASAQPYATAAAGVGLNNIDCSNPAFTTCEKIDIAFKLIGGYRVASWVAGEAVYFDFGEGWKSNRFSEDRLKTSGFGGGVALHGNVGSWTLTARAGAAWAAAKRTVTFGNLTPNSSTFTDVAPYGGVALGYRFSDHVALTLGFDAMRSKWERSDGVGLTWIVAAATAGVTIGR